MTLNMTKIVQRFLSNIFITIVQEGSEWIIYSKVIKNGKIQNKFTKNFDLAQEDGTISNLMSEYLLKLQNEYSFSYISLFLDSMGQGAICGQDAIAFEKNSIDMKSVTHLDVDKTWSVYASFIDLNWMKKTFSEVGIDFIYSPFLVLSSLLKAEKIKTQAAIYILNHQNSISISIFENGNLQFGAFFRTVSDDGLITNDAQEEDWENEKEEEGIENIIELDDIGNDEISNFDDLDELDDMSDLEDSEYGEEFLDIAPEDKNLGHFKEEVKEEDLELFGRDILLYKYLTASLKEYYKNPIYNSNFIEKLVLYDGYEVSSDLINMFEDELFMDVEINKISIHETVSKMSLKEALG